MSKEFGTSSHGGYLAPMPENGARVRGDPVALGALLDSLDLGLALLDLDYNLLYCNRFLLNLFNLDAPSALEQRLARLLAARHKAWLRAGRGDHEAWEENFMVGRRPVKARLTSPGAELPDSLGAEAGGAAWLLTLRDGSEEAAWEQALADSRVQTEKSRRARSQFLSHMSHELRTPLNAIVGFTQLLETGPLDEEQKDNLKEIKAASHHLLALINDILDVARLESGKTELAVESVDTGEVVAECLALVRPLAEKNQVAVHYHGEGLPLATDRMRLKQILLNLLSNAIKYNRAGGTVSVREFRTAGAGLRLEVQDTGIGIRAEFLDTLFSPFERLGISNDSIEGAGIGLMITRHLVTLLGGRIGLLSEPGSGSVFWAEIPQLHEAAARRAAGMDERESPGAVSILCLNSDDEVLGLTGRLDALGRPLRFHHVEVTSGAFDLPADLAPVLVLLTLPDEEEARGSLLQRVKCHKALKNVPLVAVNKERRVQSGPLPDASLERPLRLLDCIQTFDRFLSPSPTD